MSTLKAKAQKILNEKTNKLTPFTLGYGKEAYGIKGNLLPPMGYGKLIAPNFVDLFIIHNAFMNGYDFYTNYIRGNFECIPDFGMFTFNPDDNTATLINHIATHQDIYNDEYYTLNDDYSAVVPNCAIKAMVTIDGLSWHYAWKFGISKANPDTQSPLFYNEDDDALNALFVFIYPDSLVCKSDRCVYKAGMYLDDDVYQRAVDAFEGMSDSNIANVYNGAGFYLVQGTYEDNGEPVTTYEFLSKITQPYDVPYNHFYYSEVESECYMTYISSEYDDRSGGEFDGQIMINEEEVNVGTFNNMYFWDAYHLLNIFSFGNMCSSIRPYPVPTDDVMFRFISLSVDYASDMVANPSNYRVYIPRFIRWDEDTGDPIYDVTEPIPLSDFTPIPSEFSAGETLYEINLADYGFNSVVNIFNDGEYDWSTRTMPDTLIRVDKFENNEWVALDNPNYRFSMENMITFLGVNTSLYSIGNVPVQ